MTADIRSLVCVYLSSIVNFLTETVEFLSDYSWLAFKVVVYGFDARHPRRIGELLLSKHFLRAGKATLAGPVAELT